MANDIIKLISQCLIANAMPIYQQQDPQLPFQAMCRAKTLVYGNKQGKQSPAAWCCRLSIQNSSMVARKKLVETHPNLAQTSEPALCGCRRICVPMHVCTYTAFGTKDRVWELAAMREAGRNGRSRSRRRGGGLVIRWG